MPSQILSLVFRVAHLHVKRFHLIDLKELINKQFLANAPILYPQKTPEKSPAFSTDLRGSWINSIYLC